MVLNMSYLNLKTGCLSLNLFFFFGGYEMSYHQKICDLSNNEGSVIAIINECSMSAKRVMRHTLTSFELVHAGNDGLVGYYCGGKMVPVRISDAKQILTCNRCHLRKEIPNSAIFLAEISG